MNFRSAVEYIESFINVERSPQFSRLARNFNLTRIKKLLDELDQPQKKIPIIHIAGSKGKGSTALFLAEILTSAGFRTGLFTSPHFITPRERCQIDGESISETDFANAIFQMRPAIEKISEISEIGKISFFEIYTALAFSHFARQKVDFAVIEVGLGGRLDATNIVEPILSIITQISHEHTKILGNSLGEIAREKAEIIKPNSRVVVAPQIDNEVKMIFSQIGKQRNSPIIFVREDQISPHLNTSPQTLDGQIFDLQTLDNFYQTVKIPHLGDHQRINVTLAVTAIEQILPNSVDRTKAIRIGLKNAKLIGRIEIVCRKPLIIFDSAHSPSSINALIKTIKQIGNFQKSIFIVAISKDKDLKKIGRLICDFAAVVITTQIAENFRLCRSETLAKKWRSFGKPIHTTKSINDAMIIAEKIADENDLICVTGSIYLVGDAMAKLKIVKDYERKRDH